jgi:uncharacterized protein YfaT (DUF1175 family)
MNMSSSKMSRATHYSKLDSDSSRLYHCRYLYIHDTKALRITITSAGADEIAVAEFTRFLFEETFEMHVGYELSCGGVKSPVSRKHYQKALWMLGFGKPRLSYLYSGSRVVHVAEAEAEAEACARRTTMG